MAEPLVAEGRIVFAYTVDGLTHEIRAYVRNPQESGGTWFINSRTLDENDLDWEDAADGLFASASYPIGDDVTFPDMELQIRDGVVWNLVATHTGASSNTSGAHKPGAQCTLVLRDTAFKKVKVVVEEPNTASPYHFLSVAAATGILDDFSKQYTPSATVTNAPYHWQVSRGNRYLNTSSFVGLTGSLNRRVRRRRGLT